MRMISALVDKYEHCSLSDLGYILKFRKKQNACTNPRPLIK